MQENILEMRSITKEFPGVKALNAVSFKVHKGEIKALVGENGAGKSTLMNVLSGVYPYGSYTGDIVMEGKVCAFKSIPQSEQAGIAIIHQELALIPLLSIAENIFLGNEQAKKGVINWTQTRAKAVELLERVGLRDDPDTPINQIGVGKQQLVEIAKALSKNCQILILDEPTAALNEKDSRNLLDLLKQLQGIGMTCIMISHKLNEIVYVADSITVLRDGKSVADFDDASNVTEDLLIKHMVGRDLSNRYPERENVTVGDVFFELKNWTVHHPEFPEKKVIDNANIVLRKGEVVGLSGLMGAGRTEFAMSVFGRSYGCGISGEALMNGGKIDISTVPKAIANGIAYLSEDRKTYGLVLGETISKNISMANLGRISKRGVLNLNREIKETGENAKRFGVKCSSIFQNVGNLSGGNQQKVVLAKWMFNLPDVLILDEPTRGIDVGAKYDVCCIINELAAQGKCVLFISSELPELLGMCDRIYIMNDGVIMGEKHRNEATQENIMKLLV
ncbi:MAG: sugar ABC transporter ATP-binding protein [Oscillospiraceae bacterium]|nr:sugar ABC transporter ATP-binding protein [Oscillospiraceae bacterium]